MLDITKVPLAVLVFCSVLMERVRKLDTMIYQPRKDPHSQNDSTVENFAKKKGSFKNSIAQH